MARTKKVVQITIQPEHWFSDLLTAALKKNGLSGRSFSMKLQISQGYVSNIITGRIPPPKRDLEDWAAVLKLDGEMREKFMIEGLLAHAPEKIANEYRAMAFISGRFIRDEKEIGGYRLNEVKNFMKIADHLEDDDNFRDLRPDEDLGLSGPDERIAARTDPNNIK